LDEAIAAFLESPYITPRQGVKPGFAVDEILV